MGVYLRDLVQDFLGVLVGVVGVLVCCGGLDVLAYQDDGQQEALLRCLIDGAAESFCWCGSDCLGELIEGRRDT